jgi:F-type H+-transporting ATPase subunit epsilon
MANLMRVEVVSPERVLFSGEAVTVVVETVSGSMAFMAGHAPLLAALANGEAKLHMADDSIQRIAVHGGFVEVSNSKVSILSDSAEILEVLPEA